MKPCRTCGGNDRYVNGRCRPCQKAGQISLAISHKPCSKCGSDDRNDSGTCRPCKKLQDVAYRAIHKDKITARRMSRLSDDTQFRLGVNLRIRLVQSIKGSFKAGSAVRDLGCTIAELKSYLEAKFYRHPKTGEYMTWENWSRNGWHIDHVTPLASFDLKDRQQFLAACHYTNLQPLWAEANWKKGAKTT